jgi:hypothetical protein
MTRSLRLLLGCIAALASLNVCVGTGLIVDWGLWYSPSTPYRKQTDALLSGKLALSSSPADIEFDMAWAEYGVHQVWGLGVPCWRLPFELLARLVGQPAFPDRLALATALAVSAYFVLRCLTVPIGVSNVGEWLRTLMLHPARAALAFILLSFPPVLTMCRGSFMVYEEAVIYGYFYSMGLLAGAITFAQRPTLHAYLLLSLLAGLLGFVRPTTASYGVATLAVAWSCTRIEKWNWWKSLLGPGIFALGGALLFWSNLCRFGSGFEFGHRLNLTSIDLMYLSRFDAPFHEVSLWSALRELCGSLFFVNFLNGFAFYKKGVVAWQSDTPRWRSFYATTFDASYLIVVVACWFWAARRLLVRRWKADRVRDVVVLIPAAWSLVSVLQLTGFYLYFCAMSSRYVMDFAPALGAGIVGCVLAIDHRPIRSHWLTKCQSAVLVVLLAAWWAYEVSKSRSLFPPTPVSTQQDILPAMDDDALELQPAPDHYVAAINPAIETGMPYNGLGWEHPGGEARPVIILFINNPGRLLLEVSAISVESPSERQYESIRVNVGLEPLRLESIYNTDRGRALSFAAPQRAAYRTGILPVFVAFGPPGDFFRNRSSFRLLSVESIAASKAGDSL